MGVLLERQRIEKPMHVLPFFNGLELKVAGSQQRIGSCMFRTRQITSTGATRFLLHLTQCSSAFAEVREPCKKLLQGTNGKRKLKQEAASVADDEVAMKLAKIKKEKEQMKQMSIKSGFRAADSEAADRAVANFFYATVVSFNVASDTAPGSLYHQMFKAVANAPKTWKPPCRKKLAGPLLETCHDQMERDVADRDPGGVLAERFGIAVTSDGWDSTDHLPLINSAYITSNNGGVYLRSVDTSGHIKDGEYCAKLMIEDIY